MALERIDRMLYIEIFYQVGNGEVGETDFMINIYSSYPKTYTYSSFTETRMKILYKTLNFPKCTATNTLNSHGMTKKRNLVIFMSIQRKFVAIIFTQLLCSGRIWHKVIFLSGVQQVSIQCFPSPRLVTSPSLKNLVCPTIYP